MVIEDLLKTKSGRSPQEAKAEALASKEREKAMGVLIGVPTVAAFGGPAPSPSPSAAPSPSAPPTASPGPSASPTASPGPSPTPSPVRITQEAGDLLERWKLALMAGADTTPFRPLYTADYLYDGLGFEAIIGQTRGALISIQGSNLLGFTPGAGAGGDSLLELATRFQQDGSVDGEELVVYAHRMQPSGAGLQFVRQARLQVRGTLLTSGSRLTPPAAPRLVSFSLEGHTVRGDLTPAVDFDLGPRLAAGQPFRLQVEVDGLIEQGLTRGEVSAVLNGVALRLNGSGKTWEGSGTAPSTPGLFRLEVRVQNSTLDNGRIAQAFVTRSLELTVTR